ncbi:MAG: hypothetical protein AAFQ80_09475 [Cyanobacteria bacterium J06621_8]
MSSSFELRNNNKSSIKNEDDSNLHLNIKQQATFNKQDVEQVITNKEAADKEYLQAVFQTLEEEWLSEADEAAYADL